MWFFYERRQKVMKKAIKLIAAATLIALLSVVVGSYWGPLTAYAHDFPHDLNDWSEYDWQKFYEYYSRNYYPNDPTWRDYNQGVWYNGHYVYQNSNGWYYIGDDGCMYYCDSPYQQNNYYTNANNNANGYINYNYYGGVMNNYDANTEGQAQILAKIMYLYGHGVASQTQQACIAWAVVNSVDVSGSGVDIGTIAPNFHYDASKPTTDDFGRDLMPLARDVIFRWKAGKNGIGNNGRVLPSGYCWVWSTGSTVYFRNTANESGAVWNYSYTTPYGS